MGAAMAGQAGFAALDQWQKFGQSQVTASKAWDRYKDSVTRGPTWMAKGLEDAGINRILAGGGFGAGMNSAKTVQAHASGSGAMPDATANARGALMFQQKELVDKNIDAMSGKAEEGRALERWLKSDAGKDWVSQKYIKDASPPSTGAAMFQWMRNQNKKGGFSLPSNFFDIPGLYKAPRPPTDNRIRIDPKSKSGVKK